MLALWQGLTKETALDADTYQLLALNNSYYGQRPLTLDPQHDSLCPFYRPFFRLTWVSRCLLKPRMMEVVVLTGAISRAKLQSNHHHQQTNIQLFLQATCPSCRPTNSVKALNGKISHSMDLLTPSSPGGFQLCLWPLIAPGYLGEGCHASRQPLMPVPHPRMPVPH